MGRRKPGFKRRNLAKGEPSKEKEKPKDQPLFYECKKLGHFKANYLTLKKPFKKSKKKAMVITWSDSKNLSSNKKEEKIVNFCLMALEDEVASKPNLEFTFMSSHYFL